MEVIAVVTQKGGVGKTTTAQNLGAGLRLRGSSVLLVDLDPQRNLTYAAGAGEGPTAWEVLGGKASAAEAVQKTAGADIITASAYMIQADQVIDGTGKEYRLRNALEPLRETYDYIIIDSPPHLGTLVVNALTAADSIIIPAQADFFSLQGIVDLSETVRTVKTYCNPALKLRGILLTRFNGRSSMSKAVLPAFDDTAARMETVVFKTKIRECTALKEAQSQQSDIFAYAKRSNGAKDYAELVTEILTI